MRRKRVIANWKMNGDRAGTTTLLTALTANLVDLNAEVVVCPPAVYLDQAQKLLANSVIGLGAQNVNGHERGAYTGELAALMLKEFDCRYILVGHSERRSLYAETDQDVAAKFKAVQAVGITPVLCVGETEQERNSDRTEEVVLRQLGAVIAAAGIDAFRQAVVAYEPVWAIGTGNTATPEQAQQVHQSIRQALASSDPEVAEGLPILYGGSVNAENAAELFAMPDIDGGLVGGASLDSDAFTSICKAAG